LTVSAQRLEICIGNGNSGFPFFSRESNWNGNKHGVILEQEREWESLDENGREWEFKNMGKFPHSTTISVMSYDTKSAFSESTCRL